MKNKGINFGGNLCEYEIEIGSSYRCPMRNKTSSELRCVIGSGSMLDPRIEYPIRVSKLKQGYLATGNALKFRFIPSISNITPMIGLLFNQKRKINQLNLK